MKSVFQGMDICRLAAQASDDAIAAKYLLSLAAGGGVAFVVID